VGRALPVASAEGRLEGPADATAASRPFGPADAPGPPVLAATPPSPLDETGGYDGRDRQDRGENDGEERGRAIGAWHDDPSDEPGGFVGRASSHGVAAAHDRAPGGHW
jgi:hypothetical protein